MSEKEKIDQRNILNDALRESFRKMLEFKKKMGHPIVTTDGKGNPLVLSAEDAEKRVFVTGPTD